MMTESHFPKRGIFLLGSTMLCFSAKTLGKPAGRQQSVIRRGCYCFIDLATIYYSNFEMDFPLYMASVRGTIDLILP